VPPGSAGIGVDDREAELFEFVHECTQAPLIVEPLLVVGDLFGAERAARGLSRDLSTPLDVGAMEHRGVGVTVTAGVGAREVPLASSDPTSEKRWASTFVVDAGKGWRVYALRRTHRLGQEPQACKCRPATSDRVSGVAPARELTGHSYVCASVLRTHT